MARLSQTVTGATPNHLTDDAFLLAGLAAELGAAARSARVAAGVSREV